MPFIETVAVPSQEPKHRAEETLEIAAVPAGILPTEIKLLAEQPSASVTNTS